jgi:hypothetical protein
MEARFSHVRSFAPRGHSCEIRAALPGGRESRRLLGFVVSALALLPAGCGSGREAVSRSVVTAPRSSAALRAVPPSVTRSCRAGAGRVAFALLCPASWPAVPASDTPQLRWMALGPGAYLLNAFNGLDDRSPHVFHLLVGGQQHVFGVDWRQIDPALRVTTRLVRVPVVGGGTFVQQRPARRIAETTVDGAPAVVLREPPYPQGGLQGGHVLVLWNRAGHGYLTSVHGAGMTQSELMHVALALADSTSRR